jgi:hypothetical protein
MNAPISTFATLLSTGSCPADWRAYWRVHGTSWRSLIELHFEICDRLRATSSLWGSSCCTPCINPGFCALCRDADRHKARSEQPRYSTPVRPIDWSDSPHLAFLRHLMSENVSLERAWDEINRTARERYNGAPKATYNAVVYELRTYGLPKALRGGSI